MWIIIIGAGVLGTATAWFLNQNGHDVHVIDRATAAASETSFANGGLLHASHAEPWNAPGVAGQLLRWLGREDSPLLLRPGAIPGLARWGLGFLGNSRRSRFEQSTRDNTRLALYSLEVLRELRRATGLRYDHRREGIVKVFRDERGLDKALHAARLTSDLGLRYSALDARQTVALEPSLADVAHELVGSIYYPDDESGDACLFARGLAARAEAHGVRFEFDIEVERMLRDGDRISGLATSKGPRTADAYVLAAGSYSPLLARSAGLRLPIYPVKGYSFTGPAAAWREAPTIAMIDDANKVVLSILGERVRMAGTAEFTGYDTGLRANRAENVYRQVIKTFPSLADALGPGQLTAWCGLRPVTVDGRPLLGATPLRNLHLNTGTGHLGWTFACGAARLVADGMDGREPALPLETFALTRRSG